MNVQEELRITRAHTVDILKNIINKLIDLKLDIALDDRTYNKFAKYQKIDEIVNYIRNIID